jgi:hypothetical protein
MGHAPHAHVRVHAHAELAGVVDIEQDATRTSCTSTADCDSVILPDFRVATEAA